MSEQNGQAPPAITRESIAAALAEGRELDRRELVQAVLFRIEDDAATRDRILAEIYATTYQLDQALGVMMAQGPGAIMGAIFGRKGKKQRQEVEISGEG